LFWGVYGADHRGIEIPLPRSAGGVNHWCFVLETRISTADSLRSLWVPSLISGLVRGIGVLGWCGRSGVWLDAGYWLGVGGVLVFGEEVWLGGGVGLLMLVW